MIYLINMPFSSLFQPSLALSQFKAQLLEAGLPCRLLNFNFPFAAGIGFENYEPLAKRYAVDMRIGEWFFAGEAWGENSCRDIKALLSSCRENSGRFGSLKRDEGWFQEIREVIVPEFINDCLEELFSGQPPRVVAFSSVFFQTIPSLALARRIKERNPAVKTVMGGACLHGEMGREIFAGAGWLDAVSLGEADDCVVELLGSLAANRNPGRLNGIIHRCGRQEGPVSYQPVSTGVLEALPDPDFDDFINDVEAFCRMEPQFKRAPVFLPFESSRGCWWGEKSQCCFCGLNAEGMSFRARSSDNTLRMLKNLQERYPGISRFFATDNSLPKNYYRELLPRLKTLPQAGGKSYFYEIKSNVDREMVRVLAEAGVRFIQPGVESLSTHLLNCLNKGVSALKNIHLLKLCRIYGVLPLWNFLIRIPGERAEDYHEMVRLIPKIIHLFPPSGGVRPVQVHRFSPYFNEPGRFVSGISPQAWYAELFPADRLKLERVAYYFEAEWQDTLGQKLADYPEISQKVAAWSDLWLSAENLPGLSWDVLAGDVFELADSRLGRSGSWRLDWQEAWVYRAIDDPRTVEQLLLSRVGGELGRTKLLEILADFVEAGLAVEEMGRYLGLALPSSSAALPLKQRREMFRRYDCGSDMTLESPVEKQ